MPLELKLVIADFVLNIVHLVLYLSEPFTRPRIDRDRHRTIDVEMGPTRQTVGATVATCSTIYETMTPYLKELDQMALPILIFKDHRSSLAEHEKRILEGVWNAWIEWVL